MESIGERIKKRRVELGMTLAELGKKTELSVSYLSQIERDKTTPSLSALTMVAKVLNVGLRYFFETEVEAAYVIHSGGDENRQAHESSSERLCLTPAVGNNKIEVYRIALQPHTAPEQLPTYSGEEFVFVLEGELTMTVGDERIVLAAGDSVHYDALQPHCWGNECDQPCAVIWSHSASWSEHQP